VTLAEQIVIDVATVFLNEDDFAETVTRIASDGTRDDFTAILHVFPIEWNEFDKCYEQRGYVDLASTDPAELNDKWEGKAKVFKVEKLGDAMHGMRRIDLIRQVKMGARP